MDKFSERLKELRTEANLTLKQLEEKVKISKSALSRWENNTSIVNGQQLIILAKFFNVSVDYLLGLED